MRVDPARNHTKVMAVIQLMAWFGKFFSPKA